MISWRNRLLIAAVSLSLSGWAWMVLSVRPAVRPQLGLLAIVFSLLMGAVHYHYRERLTVRLITASLALGLVVHTTFAALLVAADRLMVLGVVPALTTNWSYFVIGVIGIAGAFISWTKARGTPDKVAPTIKEAPEPPPPETPELAESPDWDAAQAELARADEGERLAAVQALHRVDAALDTSADAARRVIRQEVRRLLDAAEAERRQSDDDDVLSQAASLLEWGAQKLPELAELDVSDILMGKAVADIKTTHDRVEKLFVDHRKLRSIHPIDRATAEEKCNARADAARAALPVLQANNMRLSEDLIAAEPALEAFKSVTGFQVLELPDGTYVTFEGNGRREALRRAFGDDQPVMVEVRAYRFDDPDTLATMQRRVERVRRSKKVTD